MSIGLSLGLQLGRGGRVGGAGQAAAATYWIDENADTRLGFAAANASGQTLHDRVLTVAIPVGIAPDADSLRVYELTTLDGLDRPQVWRYGLTQANALNRTLSQPASLSGQTLTVKTYGRWPTGETRRFAAYWDTGGGSAVDWTKHLDAGSRSWTAVVVSAVDTATYTLVLDGTPYSTVATGVSTTATIATALRAAINLGSQAVATGSSATVTVTPTAVNRRKTPANWVVTNTGTTTPANLTVAAPGYWSVGRLGPDTDVASYGNTTSVGFGLDATKMVATASGRLAWGHPTLNDQLRLLAFKINGDGTVRGFLTGDVTSYANHGAELAIAGTCSGYNNLWNATWTATHRHAFYAGNKNDGTNVGNVPKSIDVLDVEMVLTCATAYTPGTNLAIGSTTNQYLLSLATPGGTFLSSIAPSGEQLAQWYATAAAAPASIAANADTNNLMDQVAAASGSQTGIDAMVGTANNTLCHAVRMQSVSWSGFGSQAVEFRWHGKDLQFSTGNGSTVPQGATITVRFWVATNHTTDAAANGNVLMPSEMWAFLKALDATAAATPDAAVETYASGSVAATIEAASDRAVDGIRWYQDHAATYGGGGSYGSWNSAYRVNLFTAVADAYAPDDDDGNYGEAFKLHGLCLRYRRTHDAALIPLIETQVQFHINIEAAAVAAYGSFWNGSSPYWVAALPVTKTGEGGAGSDFDAGGSRTINYAAGDVRALCSIDQMHMVTHGLWAYLYLLRNESAITANTTLRTNARSLLNRMATFEAAHFAAYARVIPNMLAMVDGTTPLRSNGITTAFVNTQQPLAITNPYYGGQWGPWQRDDLVGMADTTLFPNANDTTDYFFRGMWAPDSTRAGIINWMRGRAMDFVATDFGRRDVIPIASQPTWTNIAQPAYPVGYLPRASGTGNAYKYSAGRTGDDHYIEIGSGGLRDSTHGRGAQRVGCMCLLALFDPTYDLPLKVEPSGAAATTIPLMDAIDGIMGTFAAWLAAEETTSAPRYSTMGYMGISSAGGNGKVIDSTVAGYWMWATELYLLVNDVIAGTRTASDYYPVPA